ncbi:MAG: putative rane protein [Verrucomicrobiales bacterium]|nr:putative rane protein [Verrucomicrobiales bacterium]
MKLLFPSHPLKARLPDPDYESEVDAARQVGFACDFYNLEVLSEGDAARALATCAEPESPAQPILYRGWMMSDTLYAQLYAELVRKGYAPVTRPEVYAEAHYLPNAYPHLAGHTPESKWMMGQDANEAWSLYQNFFHAPALIKDFVKSAKHRWNEACFIPAHTTRERFDEILKAFLEARGKQFNKGIVLRRYHELVTLERDIRGQPVHEEYRMFFWKGELLAATPSIRGEGPFAEMKRWGDIARRFQNQFLSMDVARQEDGSWIIIEVGDGEVTGLPLSIAPELFYGELRKRS